MSQIPTLDQMSKMEKEAELKRAIEERNKVSSEGINIVRIEDEEESSYSSSMSMYNIEYNRKGSKVSSPPFPTLIGVQFLDKHEEVHSSPTTDNNLIESHSKFQEEEDPLSYNINEIFEDFTLNLSKKEVSQKIVRNKKKSDGTLKEI